MRADHVRDVQRAQHEADDEVDARVVRQRQDHRAGGGLRTREHAGGARLRRVPALARRAQHADRRAASDRIPHAPVEPPRVQFQHAQGPGRLEAHSGGLLLLRDRLRPGVGGVRQGRPTAVRAAGRDGDRDQHRSVRGAIARPIISDPNSCPAGKESMFSLRSRRVSDHY